MNTKDYIYLDEDLLNSNLAQLEKGLLVKESSESGSENSDSISASSTTHTGMDGIFGFGAKLTSEIAEGDNSIETEFIRNAAEHVLSDYAVDLLIEECQANNLLYSFNNATEGKFVVYASDFQIYDFKYLSSLTNPDIISSILNMAPSDTEQSLKAIDIFHSFAKFASILCADSVLLKVEGGISICKREKLRLTPAQISFDNETHRKIKILGIISTTKEETHPAGNFKPFSDMRDLDKISSMFFDIIFSNFKILNKGDKIIKPIAIYFEDDSTI